MALEGRQAAGGGKQWIPPITLALQGRKVIVSDQMNNPIVSEGKLQVPVKKALGRKDPWPKTTEAQTPPPQATPPLNGISRLKRSWS